MTYEYSTMLVIVVIRSRELLDNVVYSLNWCIHWIIIEFEMKHAYGFAYKLCIVNTYNGVETSWTTCHFILTMYKTVCASYRFSKYSKYNEFVQFCTIVYWQSWFGKCLVNYFDVVNWKLFITNPVVHDRLRIDVREIYDVSRETES